MAGDSYHNGVVAGRQMQPVTCHRPYTDFWAFQEYFITSGFMADLVMKARVQTKGHARLLLGPTMIQPVQFVTARRLKGLYGFAL